MNKKENKYDWLEFAQSFLLLAKLACQELEDKRENKHNKVTRFDPAEMHFSYQPTDLFIPIIFDIKHGLEVFIKTVRLICTGKYKTGHDIKELFIELKNVLPKEIKPLEDKRGNSITQEDINKIPSDLDELEKLVFKYYHCELLNHDRRIVNIYDEKNDIFRYPDNKAEVKIDLNLVDEDSIKTVHEDIDKIYRLFNDLGYFVDIYRQKYASQNQTI